jgi:hypothetical protein
MIDFACCPLYAMENVVEFHEYVWLFTDERELSQ